MQSDMRFAALGLVPWLAACATAAPVEQARPGGQEASHVTCNAMSAQARLGSLASQELGAQLLAETGARTLRWVPPRSAVTMDFRPDRLTVGYDDEMKITRISCG